MTNSTSPCVICEMGARMEPTTGDSVEINCPECGKFQASGIYRSMAPSHTIEVRRQSLERARARARYGLLPRITTYDLP